MALRNAFTSDDIKSLHGKLVKLNVALAGYTLQVILLLTHCSSVVIFIWYFCMQEVDMKEVEQWRLAQRRHRRKEQLEYGIEPPTPNLDDTSLLPLVTLGSDPSADVSRIGAKAAQFAEMQRAVKLPSYVTWNEGRRSFAIPFAFYARHITTSCQELVTKIEVREKEEDAHQKAIDDADDAATIAKLKARAAMANGAHSEDTPILPSISATTTTAAAVVGEVKSLSSFDHVTHLQSIRERIEATECDAKLVSMVAERIGKWISDAKTASTSSSPSSFRGAIFRSSTNVEDLAGFNGAGLYLSERLPADQCSDLTAISRTIKRVWASVWNKAGYEERRAAGISARV
jgi:hypothetical protein